MSAQKELFIKLMNQVQLAEEEFLMPDFAQAELLSIEVNKQIPKWTFFFKTQSVPVASKLMRLYERLETTYATVAQVELSIQPQTPLVVTQETLGEYWEYIVWRLKEEAPVWMQLTEKMFPTVEKGCIRMSCSNEVIKAHIEERYVYRLQEEFQRIGFHKPRFLVQIDEKTAMEQEKVQKEKQAALEQQLAEAVAAQKEKQQQTPAPLASSALPEGVIYGKLIRSTSVVAMEDIVEEERNVTVAGKLFDVEIRIRKNTGKPYGLVKITDYTSSIAGTIFPSTPEDEAALKSLKKGMWVKCFGNVEVNKFSQELGLVIRDINHFEQPVRVDKAEEDQKRVELHMHTNMSVMDGINSAGDLIAQAAKWGHTAVAITDHANLQAYPEAYGAGKKHNIKVLYGVEANVVDDDIRVAYNPAHVLLSDATYVVFDVETTGLSAIYDHLIEVAAVKMHKGNVIGTFEEFINPGFPIPASIIQLTGITDDMVQDAKPEEQVLREFATFCEGAILVAHNANFDMGFLNKGYEKHRLPLATNPVIDTLELSRQLHPDLKSHRLNTLAKRYGIHLEQHHRAVFDSETTGHLCWVFLKEAQEQYQLLYHDELNANLHPETVFKQGRPFHATIFAKNQAGLKALFKLVSESNIHYFYREARIPRSVLNQYREHLLVGSACSSGEVFEAMMQKGYEEAKEKAAYYDFLEIMPKGIYAPLIEQELIRNERHMEEIIRNIVRLGEKLSIPVVATGNVHYLHPEDSIYREILLAAANKNSSRPVGMLPTAHFRTTDEMLREFSFLGEEVAQQVVIENTKKIAEAIDEVEVIKSKLYTPKIEGAEEEITRLSYDKAKEWYGETLPEIVQKRIEKELKSIIGNGFSVIYLISQKLVHKSNEDGYLVGSRGSVGSSLVATLTGITEVNPLAPHYRCPHCKYSEFFDDGSVGSGFDLPEKQCPVCQERLMKDGQDIPFETFLGFYGDKVPDIDLNFSGEYQPHAHNYTKVLFGEEYVYRAGTIGTVADKTAFGFVKGYERDKGIEWRQAEIDRLAQGCTGVKRSTGQHPGGIIVIPDYMDVYDFTPIQYPADDQEADWKTTHFDFHSIHDNVLKLDILGHDDPTVIRMLQDLSGMDPTTIPPDDPDVMKLFSGTEVLGVTPEQIDSKTGTLGIPEFGTRFVRGMLEQTNPKTFAELLQISGLSHGTDVYLGNAEELIREHGIPLSEVIGCRDDIMVYLIHKGLENGVAFKIMEGVRKGKGIPEDLQEEMRSHGVPEWYIQSCLKIKYMFPKAHAAAYVLMALRVAYFKVHKPLLYYCAYFSVRAQDFDLVAMAQGKEMIKARIREIRDKGMEASAKETNLLTVLEIANEMAERGFTFKMVDINKSDATNFVMDGTSLIAPFRAVPGLGSNVAAKIVEARQEQEFISKEDLATRGKVSKTLMEYLIDNKVLEGLPDKNQLSLFDF